MLAYKVKTNLGNTENTLEQKHPLGRGPPLLVLGLLLNPVVSRLINSSSTLLESPSETCISTSVSGSFLHQHSFLQLQHSPPAVLTTGVSKVTSFLSPS